MDANPRPLSPELARLVLDNLARAKCWELLYEAARLSPERGPGARFRLRLEEGGYAVEIEIWPDRGTPPPTPPAEVAPAEGEAEQVKG
jgi:hypothetical protein